MDYRAEVDAVGQTVAYVRA